MDTNQSGEGVVLTNKGYTLIGKLLATQTDLNYLGAAVGNGLVPEGTNPEDLTDLVGYVMDAEIISVDAPGNGEAMVTVQLDSTGVTEGFFVTEVALYAADPDEGRIMYCRLNLQVNPEWIRPEGNAIGKIATFDLITIVSAVKSVTAVISPTGMARMKDVPKVEMSDAEYPSAGTKTHLKVLQSLDNGAAVVEYRIYDDPQNPQTSDRRVGFPITIDTAVFDSKTGARLSDILASLLERITQLEENTEAPPSGTATQAVLGSSFFGLAYLDGSVSYTPEPIAAFLQTESGELISGAVILENGETAELVFLPVNNGQTPLSNIL